MRERVRVEVYSRQWEQQKHKIQGVYVPVVHSDHSQSSGWQIMGYEPGVVDVCKTYAEESEFYSVSL